MSLRVKTILTVIIVAIISTGALLISSQMIIEKSFILLEDETAQQTMKLAFTHIDEIRLRLVSINKDWATWDDSYNFLKHPTTKFIEQNLQPSALVTIQVNFLIFCDTAGTIQFFRFVDLATQDTAPFPQSLRSLIDKSKFLSYRKTQASGILATESVCAMISTCPVLKSNQTGPAAGVLIAGLILDTSISNQVSLATNLPVTINSINQQRRSAKSDSCTIRAKHRNTLEISGIIHSLAGTKAIQLIIKSPRDIVARGRMALSSTFYLLLIVSIIFVILIIVILEKNVLRTLQTMSGRLRDLTQRSDASLRLPHIGKNEFGKLTSNINGLLESLQNSNILLLHSQSQYRDLFNEMTTGFALFQSIHTVQTKTSDLIFIEVNPAFERITNLNNVEIKGTSLRETLPNLEPRWHEKISHTAFHETSSQFEGYIAALDKHFEIRIFSPSKGIAALLFSDISARKNAELEKERIQIQFLHAQKMEAVGTMAGGIAHDFNNLLCAIQGYADLLLREDQISPFMKKGLTTINDASTKGAKLVKQLLTFGRKAATNPELLNLNAIIQQIIELFERSIPASISINLILDNTLNTIRADASQIEQIFMNLALNSRDAMPDGGTLTITTSNCILGTSFVSTHPGARGGAYVVISVSDTGGGITAEAIRHIFEPFFTTKQTGKGTGLGLSTAYGIVKNHNGYIDCQSTQQTGTTFTVYLPSLPEEPNPGAHGIMPKLATVEHDTILIIDDEKIVRENTSSLLVKHGYKVLTVDDGTSGVAAYRANPQSISLVILDMIMPTMGGRECAEQLISINPDVKIIIASGYAQSLELQKILKSKNRAFIGKPYTTLHFLQAVSAMLQSEAI